MFRVEGLCKAYEEFRLEDVSFHLEKGCIMGFVGRNGAGKSTTLKSILGMVQPDAGRVEMFGLDFYKNERACKEDLGLIFGGADYYPKKRLRDISAVFRSFYKNWDEALYLELLERFALPESKRVEELSAGMRVKYALTLALSHGAKLLILDEPTSGLDPASRMDLLELFRELVEDGERSLLFSTHITSDIEHCADYITYIRNGRIEKSADRDSFLESYRLLRGDGEQLQNEELKTALIGFKQNAFGYTGLVLEKDLQSLSGLYTDSVRPSLEEILVYYARGEEEARCRI